MSHTPGPWLVGRPENIAAACDVMGPDGRLIARTARNGERDANARLIAAAPELLAALKGLMIASGAAAGRPEVDNAYEAKARKAIAKAEGR